MDNWNYSVFWDEAINQAKTELSENEFAMWFNIQYDSSTEKTIVIRVPSTFYKDQLVRQYQKYLEDKLFDLMGRRISIDFIVVKPTKVETESAGAPAAAETVEKAAVRAKEPPARDRGKHPQLRTDYTFENFVIGDNNGFASNAALAIAKNPGTAYNPFLIYGGVGLGKTHLMQSIGNRVWAESPKIKVICITAEEFTNEFIQSIHDKTTQNFKNKYRYVDVLLIDDIHFLQNKLGSQEELFHTFNALYDANKQMVFTCDRPVSELKNLSDRLRSRFERGLNVDLQPPNFETRSAILKKKIEVGRVHVPDEVVEMIAKNISTNVRDLEAALTKLVAYSELVHRDITLEIAQNQLKDVFSQTKHGNVTIDNIVRVVADYYKLSYNDLKGKKRTKNIAFPRQVAMYIARDITEYSTTELGFEFGGRDHTTVMHACQKIEERLKLDPNLDSSIQSLIRTIKEYSSKI
jgi:chromosomal replication initiator protein